MISTSGDIFQWFNIHLNLRSLLLMLICLWSRPFISYMNRYILFDVGLSIIMIAGWHKMLFAQFCIFIYIKIGWPFTVSHSWWNTLICIDASADGSFGITIFHIKLKVWMLWKIKMGKGWMLDGKLSCGK